jgi:succinoglycan biosynthesis transport protein ExoP
LETDRYAQIIRAHWILILVTTLIVTAAAAAYAWTREDIYAAHTQLFVSTPVAPKDLTPSEVYQGGLASQARAESYARLVSSPELAEAVIEKLGLRRSVSFVQSALSASVLPGTVLINVTVEDPSPREAKGIADAVGEEFPRYVNELEGTPKEGAPSSADEPPSVHVAVSSPAELPRTPESTSKAFYLVGGVLLGLVLGMGGAVLREMFDRRIKDYVSIEAVAGAPVLGYIPRDRYAASRPLVVVEDSLSIEAEAYRRLRTNLRVLTLEHDRHSLLVTSAVAGEGKTLIATNLAFAFAQAGHRVVLVDADMRSARLSEMLGLGGGPGLSDVLSGTAPEKLHEEQSLPLSVLSSGTPLVNPSELLESDGFASLLHSLKQRADLVIMDSPPLLPVSDAAIVARAVDAVLLVARVASTQEDQLDAAADSLAAVDRQPVGAVVNGLSAPVGGSYAYDRINTTEIPEPTVPAWD